LLGVLAEQQNPGDSGPVVLGQRPDLPQQLLLIAGEDAAQALLPLGEILAQDVAVEVLKDRAGHDLRLKIAGALGAGQTTDFFAAQRAVLLAGAHQHAPVLQGVQFHAARHADGDDAALLRLELLPVADHHRRAALLLRLAQGGLQILAVGMAHELAGGIQADHDHAAVGVGEGDQRLGQRVGGRLREQLQARTRPVLESCQV